MLAIRPAEVRDLELLVRIELADEGVTPGYRGDHPIAEVRRNMTAFIDDGGALIAVTEAATPQLDVGVIAWRLRDLATVESWSVFRQLDPSVFPASGVFAEIFQLWVDPDHRRRGIATALKRAVETAARARGAGMIYTHTEAQHDHVLALNRKLGYREVRRGPIWDAVVRVSLIKSLDQ